MLWLLLIISAIFFFSFANIFDKILVDRYTKNPLLSIAACNILMAPILAILTIIWPPAMLDGESFLALSIATLLGMVGGALYYKIMQKSEASRIIVVLQTAPVFIMILAIIFLGERPSAVKVLGVISIVTASLLVSKKSGLKFDRWSIAATASSFIFAIYFITLKSVLQKYDAWSVFLWNMIIAVLAITAFSPIYLKKLFENFREKPKLIKIAFASQVCFLFGHILRLNSLHMAEAALIGAVGGIQPIIVFSLSYALSSLLPNFFKEDFSKESLKLKALGALLAAVGVALIAL
ncbi:MAG: EamA family transporter [Candidatus Diapherotrites archaeon]|nr:EamA family transporter [Candidatus Diapherotrites archaeon]